MPTIPPLDGPYRSVFYVGVTSDLVRRVAEHRARIDPACFTARYGVDRLVHFEAFADMLAAIEREKTIKGWRRSKKMALVARHNPAWDDLWPRIVA